MADGRYEEIVCQAWRRSAKDSVDQSLTICVPLYEADDEDEREFRRQIVPLPFVKRVDRDVFPDGSRGMWFRVCCWPYSEVMSRG